MLQQAVEQQIEVSVYHINIIEIWDFELQESMSKSKPDVISRGGYWGNHAPNCRSEFRGLDPRSLRHSYTGFRIMKKNMSKAKSYLINHGGDWANSKSRCRSAFRGYNSHKVYFSNLGFRIMRKV